MSGALLQLVAYGAQDVYLTGEPKVTFFKSAYKRYTNFAMETIKQTVNGSLGNGSLMSVTVRRNGDLIGDMFVQLQSNQDITATYYGIPGYTGGFGYPDYSPLVTNNYPTAPDMCWVAERAFSQVELFIGGQSIDRHFQLWFRLYSEVFLDETKRISWGKMTTSPVVINNGPQKSTSYVYLPLLFFFNKHPGLYLPLIALQYHEVRIDFTLSSNYNTYFGTNNFSVWSNYIFLDTSEREMFAKKPHEYLIEQVQHIAGDGVSSVGENSPSIIRLNYNHPVKEIVWCYQYQDTTNNPNSLWNFTSNIYSAATMTCGSSTLTHPQHSGCPVEAQIFLSEDGDEGMRATDYTTVGPLNDFYLMFNGQRRFEPQAGKYFNQYQPYQYNSGNPMAGIYVYSFALRPEDLQPSGSCNFSRLDMAECSLTLKTGVTAVAPRNQQMFAINYNILRIQSGLGGLAFSN
jgi:hypothetical protein